MLVGKRWRLEVGSCSVGAQSATVGEEEAVAGSWDLLAGHYLLGIITCWPLRAFSLRLLR